MNKLKSVKILFGISSGLLAICGLLHIHGIFFTTDLYPLGGNRIVDLMKTSPCRLPIFSTPLK